MRVSFVGIVGLGQVLVEGVLYERIGDERVREATLVAVDALALLLAGGEVDAVEELAREGAVHVEARVALGAEAVQIVLADLILLGRLLGGRHGRHVVAEGARVALLAAALDKEVTHDRLAHSRRRRRRLLGLLALGVALLLLLLDLHVLLLLEHLLLDGRHRDHVRSGRGRVALHPLLLLAAGVLLLGDDRVDVAAVVAVVNVD